MRTMWVPNRNQSVQRKVKVTSSLLYIALTLYVTKQTKRLIVRVGKSVVFLEPARNLLSALKIKALSIMIWSIYAKNELLFWLLYTFILIWDEWYSLLWISFRCYVKMHILSIILQYSSSIHTKYVTRN